jgi:hypothetical protein
MLSPFQEKGRQNDGIFFFWLRGDELEQWLTMLRAKRERWFAVNMPKSTSRMADPYVLAYVVQIRTNLTVEGLD